MVILLNCYAYLSPTYTRLQAPNSYILESILSNRSTLDRAGTKNNSIVESGFILRELETLFYDPRATPPSLVGPVSFTFIPSESESTDSSLTLKVSFNLLLSVLLGN